MYIHPIQPFCPIQPIHPINSIHPSTCNSFTQVNQITLFSIITHLTQLNLPKTNETTSQCNGSTGTRATPVAKQTGGEVKKIVASWSFDLMIWNIDFDDLVISDQVFMFQMCFIHRFVASSCHGGGDEAIIGQQRLFEIGFRDYSSELFTCPSKDDYWIWDFTQGHEDEPEGDKRSSFCRKIMEFFFCLQHFLILLWIWIKASNWTELLSGSCWPFLVWSTQHSKVYSGIVAHSSTLRTKFLTGRLWTVRQSESCGNACFIWFGQETCNLKRRSSICILSL